MCRNIYLLFIPSACKDPGCQGSDRKQSPHSCLGKALQREVLIKQAHHTTSIERNPLTLEEVGPVIDGKDVLAHEKSKKEIQNYVDVLK